MAIPYSLLDLAPISEGFGVKDALNNSKLMAMEAERSGYERVWLAEHHGMHGVASSATSVVLTHIANATATIKVGAGGIMLPNHAPLVIAEQFGTLAELFPNRIELGLGRAPDVLAAGDRLAALAQRGVLGGRGAAGAGLVRILDELLAHPLELLGAHADAPERVVGVGLVLVEELEGESGQPLPLE